MKKMVSPSAVGVAAATARVDPRAIAATTTVTKVAAAMVCLEQIPSRSRYLHQRMIIVKRTRGAIKSREASPLASWVELKLLYQIVTSSSCRERSRRHNPTSTTA
jgi:CRISPR/Cas system CMR-associated protein Cmr1 (group 7 of RAMP superfamily)